MKLGTRPLLAKMPPPPKKVLRQDRATPEPDFRRYPAFSRSVALKLIS